MPRQGENESGEYRSTTAIGRNIEKVKRPASVVELIGVLLVAVSMGCTLIYRGAILEERVTAHGEAIVKNKDASDAEIKRTEDVRLASQKTLWERVAAQDTITDSKIDKAVANQTQIITAKLEGFSELLGEKITSAKTELKSDLANTNRRIDDMKAATR